MAAGRRCPRGSRASTATPPPSTTRDLFARNGEDVLYYLRVNAPEELFDADVSRQIVDSLTLKG